MINSVYILYSCACAFVSLGAYSSFENAFYAMSRFAEGKILAGVEKEDAGTMVEFWDAKTGEVSQYFIEKMTIDE